MKRILQGDENQELSTQPTECLAAPETGDGQSCVVGREVAQTIADYLFRDNGSGEVVKRLVLSREGEDSGRSGWSKQVVIDHVEDALKSNSASYQRRLYDECVTAGWDTTKQNTFAEEVAHLHEELSEAFRAFRRYRDFEVREVNGKPEGIPIEFADVLIGLFYNAELHGFDLFAAVEQKHQFNLKRNYVAEGRQLHVEADTTVQRVKRELSSLGNRRGL